MCLLIPAFREGRITRNLSGEKPRLEPALIEPWNWLASSDHGFLHLPRQHSLRPAYPNLPLAEQAVPLGCPQPRAAIRLRARFKNIFLRAIPSARRRRNPQAGTPSPRSAGLPPSGDGRVSPPIPMLKHPLSPLMMILLP